MGVRKNSQSYIWFFLMLTNHRIMLNGFENLFFIDFILKAVFLQNIEFCLRQKGPHENLIFKNVWYKNQKMKSKEIIKRNCQRRINTSSTSKKNFQSKMRDVGFLLGFFFKMQISVNI